jgi:polysaccharide biosynthesis protein PslH
MKILWVKAGGLVPPDTGGKIRSYNILRELARRHSVSFFSFYPEHDDDQHPGLIDIFEKVVCVPLTLPPAKSMTEMLSYALQLFSSEPYGIKKFCRPEVHQKLRELMERSNYDVMVCDFMAAAGVVPWNSKIAKVLFTHNVEATIWRRHFEVAGNPAWKAVSWLEWRKMEAAERRYLQLADRVLTVSETDRETFSIVVDRAKITVIPTGVDVEYFQPQLVEEVQNSLVFTGSMDWLPNEDAVFYFVDKILPLIREQCSDVVINVVGRKPSRKLQSFAESRGNIRLTGWVEDIRPFVARGSVCIVPLRIGGGTRLKIFEAMAMGKAVVSTSIGAEGLPVITGENILLADYPREFADQVISLFSDIEKRKRLGRAARTSVEEKYSWANVAQRFAETLENTISQHASVNKRCG